MKTFTQILSNSKTISRSFPFGFVLDRDMRIAEAGRSLSAVIPNLTIGSRADQLLEFIVPKRNCSWTIEFFKEHMGELIVFQIIGLGTRLRAECFVSDDFIAINATPAITTHDALENLGLSFGHFPLTDSISDSVFVLSMQYQTLRETRMMAEKVSKSYEELKAEANRREEVEAQLHLAHRELRERNTELSLQKADSDAQAVRYKELMNNIPGVFYRCSCDKHWTMNHMSAGIEQLTGYSVDDIVDNKVCSFSSLIHPDDSGTVEKSVLAAVESGTSWDLEYRLRSIDGTYTWVSEQGVGVRDSLGNVRFLDGFVADISERKAIKEALINTSREAGKAEVATGVLHNVGNVMNSVNVSVGLLKSNVRESLLVRLKSLEGILDEHGHDLASFFNDDPRGKHFTPFVRQLGSEADSILNEIKSLQKNIDHVNAVVASQQSYATTGGTEATVQLSNVVEDAIRIVEVKYQESRINIVREFETLPSVSIDKQRLIQVLVNLLNNARLAIEDHNEGQRQVTAKIRRAQNDLIAIDVVDTGIGIPSENLVKLFKHGFSTRKSLGGHGFGLHHSFNAMVEVGGSLKAYSAGQDQGATFTLEMPIDEPHPSTAHLLTT